MAEVVRITVLGGRRAPDDPDAYDAADVAVVGADGTERIVGFRNDRFLREHGTGAPEWNGYTGLAVTVDLDGVRHWDFARVAWIGDGLFWVNAALREPAIAHALVALGIAPAPPADPN